MSNALTHGELALFDCPRIRKSEFWQFIKLVAPRGSPPDGRTHWLSQDATDAYCLRCSKMFRFTKGSSNSVRRHMERFHRKELLKRQADSKKNAAATRKIATASAAGGGGNNGSASAALTSTTPATGAARKPKRTALTQDAEVLGGDDATTQRAVRRSRVDGWLTRDPRHGEEALVRWLVLSMRPFSILEDPGFAAFVEAMSGEGQHFVVPSREALCHRLELMSEAARFEVKQTLKKNVVHCALSAELWCAGASQADAKVLGTHVSVKCSYLSEDFVMQSCVLDAIAIQEFTSGRLERLLADFGLVKASVSLLLLPHHEGFEDFEAPSNVRMLVDVVSNLDSAVAKLLPDEDRLRALEDSPTEALASKQHWAMSKMRSALEDVMHLVKWAQSESSARMKLETLFPAAAVELSRLPVNELSTWSLATAHDFASRALSIRVALDELGDQSRDDEITTGAQRPRKVSSTSWHIVEGLVVLWRPLYEIVHVVTNEKVCSLPFLLPIVTVALQLFERLNLFDELNERYSISDEDGGTVATGAKVLETLRSMLESTLRDSYGESCSTLCWISALDPRYARLRHLADPEREVCKELLLQHATELYTSQLPPASVSVETLGSLSTPEFENEMMFGETRSSGQSMPGLMHRLLYDEDEDTSASPDPVLSRDAELAQARLYVANEISVYLNEHQLRKTRISCPLRWWSENRERFPFLAPLARLWLSTSTCSSSRSRVMSAAFCESLGSKEQENLRRKLIGDTIVVQGHCQIVSSSDVSL